MLKRDCHFWDKNSNDLDLKRIKNCFDVHGKALVVIGDSHPMNLYNIISHNNKYPFIIGVSQGGCRPYGNRPNCQYDNFVKFALENFSLIGHIVYH